MATDEWTQAPRQSKRVYPIEKFVTFYDFSEVNRAAKESSEGLAIKPALRMPADG